MYIYIKGMKRNRKGVSFIVRVYVYWIADRLMRLIVREKDERVGFKQACVLLRMGAKKGG